MACVLKDGPTSHIESLLKKMCSCQTTKHTLSDSPCQTIFSSFPFIPFCNFPFPHSPLVPFLFLFLLLHSSFLFPVCSPVKNISHLCLSWSWTQLESLSPTTVVWIIPVLPTFNKCSAVFLCQGHMYSMYSIWFYLYSRYFWKCVVKTIRLLKSQTKILLSLFFQLWNYICQY